MIPGGMDNYIYVVAGGDAAGAVAIDPFADRPVRKLLDAEGLELSHILATHHHGDHTDGIPGLKKATEATVVGPVGGQIASFDQTVGEGDRLSAGPLDLVVWETPGHTGADLTFVANEPGMAWCGDTLFSVGCGRLFECGPDVMFRSLERLAQLPPATMLFCGHEYTESNIRYARTVDPENEALQERDQEVQALRGKDRPTLPTTVERELAINPFLRCSDSGIRRSLGLEDATDVDVFAELRARKDRF
jgi:hydroxyacylglutathione hydrolase